MYRWSQLTLTRRALALFLRAALRRTSDAPNEAAVDGLARSTPTSPSTPTGPTGPTEQLTDHEELTTR